MSPRRFAVLLFLAFSFASMRRALADEARLVVLHTTDLHGRLLSSEDAADVAGRQGLLRIATKVKSIRAEGQPVLLVDVGDALEGSALVRAWQQSDASGADPTIEAMNRLAYDAMAVGNHEFDRGLPGLARARAQSRFPWLAANIVQASDGSAAFTGSVVKTAGFLRVGVVGVCTPAVPSLVDSSRWAGLAFTDPVAAAQREVARLRAAEKCDVVVVLAHTGLGGAGASASPDEHWGRRIAAGVPDADAVLLGHSHVVIPSQDVNGTLVSQAGAHGTHLGRVDFTLTRGAPGQPWRISAKRAAALAIDDSTAADPEIAAAIEPQRRLASDVLRRTLGETVAAFEAPRREFEDHALWQLVHRIQLEASGADVSLAPPPSGLLARGPITQRDVYRLFPYDNTLGVVTLTGAQLKAVLERAAEYLDTYTFEDRRPLAAPGRPAWNFLMAHGVRYAIDLTAPPGRRIAELTFDGQSLDPSRPLRVAVNSYALGGGGGFVELQRAPRVWRSSEPLPVLAAGFFAKHRVVSPAVAPSWSLLPDYAAWAERPLIDRLVRHGVLPRDEALRLGPAQPARLAHLAVDIGRAFGWRSARSSGAFADVPDDLAPWVDGVMKRRVLGARASSERFEPRRVATLTTALDWSERAARAAGYALGSKLGDAAFRRSLVTGIALGGPASRAGFAYRDTLTRAQWLGILANLRLPALRVLETTDFHGGILGGGRDRRTQRAFGGTVALAGWIGKLRAENPEGTILLDGGDMFQGTMVSNLQFGRPVIEQMNALGYAAGAVGNHEFDWNADTLAQRAAGARFSMLAANMTERHSGRRPWWARSDTSFNRRGIRVGVLGLAYPGTPRVTLPAHVAHLRFGDDSAAAAPLALRLRREGAAVVLGVGHIPGETDSTRKATGDLARLARGVRGVDAWFGGHSHNVIDDEVAGVPAMIAGSHGNWVAMLDLLVDPVAKRVLEARRAMFQTFADDVPPDTAWSARVQRWNAGVAPIAAEVLGTIDRPLDRGRPESTIGNFITDAMRVAVQADIAMQNPGGMRANLDAGPITRGDVYEIMPFDNTIVTVTLTGADVKLAIEQALRGDRVTQVSGVRYTYDMSRPALQRVTSITLADGSPLDPSATYRVAANNFMASGGDSYDALGGGRDKTDTGLIIRGALEAYVRERCVGGRALDVKADGRIRQAP